MMLKYTTMLMTIRAGYDYESVKSKLILNVNKLMSWFKGNYMKVNAENFQYFAYWRASAKNLLDF